MQNEETAKKPNEKKKQPSVTKTVAEESAEDEVRRRCAAECSEAE